MASNNIPANSDLSVYRLKRLHTFQVQRPLNSVLSQVDASTKRLEEEVKQEENKKVILHQERIQNLSTKISRPIYSISTFFPFDLLPHNLVIEETKVNLIFRIFFGASQIHSVDIKDITNIFLETAPLFATIKIVSKTFTENEIAMKKLKKKDATKAKEIIETLRLLHFKGVDTTKLSTHELIETIRGLSGHSVIRKYI